VIRVQLVLFELEFVEQLLSEATKGGQCDIKSIELRLGTIKESLCLKDSVPGFQFQAIERAHSFFLYKLINVMTLRGQLIQSMNFLTHKLETALSQAERSEVLKSLVSYATTYNLMSRTELEDTLAEYDTCLNKEELEQIALEMYSDPNSAHIYSFSLGAGTLSLANTKDKNISTLIRFSIPFECKHQQTVTVCNDECKPFITFSPITSFWCDPMFEAFMSAKIGNIGWNYFSDLNKDDAAGFCHVVIEIKDLYVPDLKLVETNYESIDFSEKEQIEGKKYYPHKELAIKTMLDAYDVVTQALNINKKEISSNIFSNFTVQYVDNDKNENIAHKLFALTSPDSFTRSRSLFLEKLASINFQDTYISIKSLLGSTKIETARNLKEFITRTIELIIKKNVEDEGGYRYLWNRNGANRNYLPLSEPEIQPYIIGHLKLFYECAGVQISREVVSANGQIDFLVTFNNTRQEKLMVCVELKLAHNSTLTKGLNMQLPRYMRAERAKHGVFIILWFKGSESGYEFDKPKQYNTVEQLSDELHKVKAYTNISITSINCSKPISPSKLK
jgi:hypothetical protein